MIKNKSKFFLTAMAAILAYNPVCHAVMNDGTRGGGEDIGVEFTSRLVEALAVAKSKDPVLYADLIKFDPLNILHNATVIGTDDDLQIVVDAAIQHPVAINNPDTGLIEVNKERWHAIKNDMAVIKQAISIHETLSLKKIERTGYYPYSGVYLAIFNMPANYVIGGNPSIKFNFEAATEVFAHARRPDLKEVLGKWVLVGMASSPTIAPELTPYNGFWPNGNQTLDYGYMRYISEYSLVNDAFQISRLVRTIKWFSSAEGIWHLDGPLEVAQFSHQSLVIPQISELNHICYSSEECKIVPKTGMLLCAITSQDERTSMNCHPPGQTYVYEGYIHAK